MISFGEVRPPGTYPTRHSVSPFLRKRDEASELQSVRSENITFAIPLDVGWLWQRKWRPNMNEEVW